MRHQEGTVRRSLEGNHEADETSSAALTLHKWGAACAFACGPNTRSPGAFRGRAESVPAWSWQLDST
eukprot:2158466-Alexandrium_andersonii.AAC.1